MTEFKGVWQEFPPGSDQWGAIVPGDDGRTYAVKWIESGYLASVITPRRNDFEERFKTADAAMAACELYETSLEYRQRVAVWHAVDSSKLFRRTPGETVDRIMSAIGRTT